MFIRQRCPECLSESLLLLLRSFRVVCFKDLMKERTGLSGVAIWKVDSVWGLFTVSVPYSLAYPLGNSLQGQIILRRIGTKEAHSAATQPSRVLSFFLPQTF